MSDLSRRDAFKALAGGAAGAVAVSSMTDTSMASTVPGGHAAGSSALAGEVREASARLASLPVPGPGAVTGWARVLAVRSWSREVYLVLEDSTRGLASVTEAGLAIAAACQAADRSLAVCVWGHEPNFAGVGRFAGALVAMDVADLPPAPRV